MICRRELSTKGPEFEAAARACIHNAQSLRRSAAMLARKQAFGQATALLTIALEELGKAVAFKLCAEGYGKLEGSGRKRKVVLRMPILGTLEVERFDHADKRGIPVSLELAVRLLPALPRLFGAFARVATDERGERTPPRAPGTSAGSHELTKKVATKLEAMHARARREAELIPRLGMLKESGLYVDFDGSSLGVPDRVDRQTYEVSARVVKGYADMVIQAVDRGIIAGVVTDLVASVLELLNQMSEQQAKFGK